MENSVEVRYAGVVVGRGAVRELGSDADGVDRVFVGIPEPLPVGTLVTLKIGDAVREARVDDVVESSEPTAVGMRVRWGAVPAARPAPAPAPQEVVASSYSEPTSAADSGPTPTVDAVDEGSGAISAPLSLAGPGGDGTQSGGGKKRRKRR